MVETQTQACEPLPDLHAVCYFAPGLSLFEGTDRKDAVRPRLNVGASGSIRFIAHTPPPSCVSICMSSANFRFAPTPLRKHSLL
jgi:hypothetical protein